MENLKGFERMPKVGLEELCNLSLYPLLSLTTYWCNEIDE
jgi:hypothetical protein